MKIKITREATNNFFAEILWEPWVHAVANSPELALEYLFDVYAKVHELKKEKAEQKLNFQNNLIHSPLLNTSFKSLTVSL
jgi:predicted RNase H-like HicB family nuclease